MADAEQNRSFGGRCQQPEPGRADGALELYDGGLRARDADRETIFDHALSCDYADAAARAGQALELHEVPLHRNRSGRSRLVSRRAAGAGQQLRLHRHPAGRARAHRIRRGGRRRPGAGGAGHPLGALIELLHCAEAIERLLDDPDIARRRSGARGRAAADGIGVIEAPRGTLFHHYEIDADGLVTKANLIVSTTNNNQAMNESIRRSPADDLDGHKLTEPLLNRIEVAIRAYDPCLSCATHAVGKMPKVPARSEVRTFRQRDAQSKLLRQASADLIRPLGCYFLGILARNQPA
jgi:NAD-reducing hydrogenase large subunit